MRFTTGKAVEFVGTGTGPAKNATQHTAEAASSFADHANFVRPELAHEAVTTAVAKELELKAHIGAMIGIVSSKLNVGHLIFLLKVVKGLRCNPVPKARFVILAD